MEKKMREINKMHRWLVLRQFYVNTCLNLARIFSRLTNNSSFMTSLIGRAKIFFFRVSNNLVHLKQAARNTCECPQQDNQRITSQHLLTWLLWWYLLPSWLFYINKKIQHYLNSFQYCLLHQSKKHFQTKQLRGTSFQSKPYFVVVVVVFITI